MASPGKMKVAIATLPGGPGENKDAAGGFGTRFPKGAGIFSKILFEVKSKVKYPSPTLAYACAIFRSSGHSVEILEDSLPKNPPDLLLIPSSIIGFQDEALYCRRAKEKFPLAKIGVLMPYASLFPEGFLGDGLADFVVKGEPESALIRIAKGGRIPKGLVGSRPIDPKNLPFPDWTGFPAEKYSYFPALPGRPYLPVLSSRGCPYSCSYCPYLVMWGPFRARSPKNIVQELVLLERKHNVKSVSFRDPCFSANRERVLEICRLLKKEFSGKVPFRWSCETRPDLVDRELLLEMKSSGLFALEVGYESENQSTVSRLGRKTIGKERILSLAKTCRDLGVRLTVFYMLGLPGESFEDCERTVEFSKKVNSFAAQFTIYTPFPGTKGPGKLGRADKGDSFSPNAFGKIPPEKLSALRERAQTGYFLRLSWLISNARLLLLP